MVHCITSEKLKELTSLGMAVPSNTKTGNIICLFCEKDIGKRIDAQGLNYEINLCNCTQINKNKDKINGILGEGK